MNLEAKVTTKGQLTLPVEVRRRLGVKPGDRLAFEQTAEGFTVRVVRQAPDLSPFVGRFRVGKGKSAQDVNRWLRELRGRDEA